DPHAPRRLVRVKSNLGPDGGGFEYELFSEPVPGQTFGAQRVDWGSPLEGTPLQLLEVEQPADGRALEAAEAFLADLLKDDQRVTVKEIKAAENAHGIAWATVRRAKDKRRVVATKTESKDGPWVWHLPDAKVFKSESEGAQQDET